ncbi:hypothetical protein DBB29_12320 [Pandoraea cepalis]|uniref:CopG family transcriptional regulator n=1 Tax=Pandoraea cepalis TaxID=2508294 RepID=A0AAW7MH18_9BURK|nr:hypothetical protein [Pandoraea cepalis]MDN4572054.1 hypothetical protein [Pandoraea cepalis]MDN4578900.1 hypothetical protein [Pandoraea cepalis]
MKKVTSIRFEDELKAALEAIADKRDTNVSSVVNLACAQFVRDEGLREEFATLGGSFVASFSALTKETMRVSDDLQLVIAWLDLLTKFQFQATPEVVDKKSAAIVGARRYKRFLTSFKEVMEGSRRRASVLTEVLGGDDGAEDSTDGSDVGEGNV